MPKFTVKMIYTATVEAENKESAYMLAASALDGAAVVPELIITRYKTPKTLVAVDTRTEQMFPEEKA